MRMWLCNPKIMCRKHLLGSHVELHMLIGSLQRKRSLTGFIDNNLIEPLSIPDYHEIIVNEMNNRGYNHSSKLNFDFSMLDYLNDDVIYYQVNRKSSLQELLSRCEHCRKKFAEI